MADTYTIEITQIVTTESGSLQISFEKPVIVTDENQVTTEKKLYRFEPTLESVENLVGVQWYGAIILSSQKMPEGDVPVTVKVFNEDGTVWTGTLNVADLIGAVEGDSAEITQVTP